MKQIKTLTQIVLMALCVMSCKQNEKNEGVIDKMDEQAVMKDSTENFDWLLGFWKRSNEEEGRETFETWKKLNDTEYVGFGFTLKNGDTISQEKLRLLKNDMRWDILVKVPDEDTPTMFKGTGHNKNEFNAENNAIDFPNHIKYWRDGDNIKALISNAEMEVSFEFKKMKK